MGKIKEKLLKKSKTFPNNPGIYWFSKKGKRVYVGKAGSLKKRISSYFRSKDPRINMMVNEADNVSFKKTNSVLEAVILEANAIKKYSPKYNVKDKDNRSFVYLIISKGDYPKVFIARGREVKKYIYPHMIPRGQMCGQNKKSFQNKSSYIFGPYQSYKILKTALNLARKIFPFGTCRPNQGKPCFDYQIGLCPGICIDAISKKDYKKNIKNLILFFRGEHKRLLKKLKKENPEKIFALQYVNDVALISNSNIENSRLRQGFGGQVKFKIKNSAQRIEGYDISHFSGSEPVGAMVVFVNGAADNSQYRLFKIKTTQNKFDDLAMLSEILNRRFNHKEWPMPDIVLIDGGRNQVARAKKVLSELNIFVPIVGIAKVLGHSGRAAIGDKLFFENTKPRIKKLLLNSRILFQQVRNEAHRFAISFQRRRRSKSVSYVQ
ncbi:MAG: GIY-YIG nuclease family protein [Parcubacteria group bacterium]|nr:GIY-YIG nuclease family protein [Parcubacteria group bacterium]